MFAPPRRRGLILQSAVVFLLFTTGAACLILAFKLPVGSGFVLLALAGLVLLAPIPLLAYRIYALFHSSYQLGREGLRLTWGLHAEDIPIQEIEWLRPASDLVVPLALPRFAWPGALLGMVQAPDLGAVEFFASDRSRLLLIATPARVYAISPADPHDFTRAFRNAIEMGSIETLPPRSKRAAVSLTRVWGDPFARILVAGGLVLSLLVFLAVGLGIGSRVEIQMGFGPDRQPLDPVPAVQALLLPTLAATIYAYDFLLGLIFFRRKNGRPIAYLLWAGGFVAPLVFLIAAWFIL